MYQSNTKDDAAITYQDYVIDKVGFLLYLASFILYGIFYFTIFVNASKEELAHD